MNGKAYGSIALQLLAATIAITLWILCRNQPDMGGQLIYGYIGLPATGTALFLSTILAILCATNRDQLKVFRNRTITINIFIAMTAIYAAGKL